MFWRSTPNCRIMTARTRASIDLALLQQLKRVLCILRNLARFMSLNSSLPTKYFAMDFDEPRFTQGLELPWRVSVTFKFRTAESNKSVPVNGYRVQLSARTSRIELSRSFQD